MGRVFFVSDLHLGHRYVAGLRWEAIQNPDYTWNPRTDVTDEIIKWHDDMLAQNWDRVVNPDGDRGDQVWVLGDISGGGSRDQKAALAWMLQRPGTKHLIAGNHDGVFPAHRDAHKWFPLYTGVFASVSTAARRKIAGEQVLLSHFPYGGDKNSDHTIEERYPQWRLPDLGTILLHGHVHSSDLRVHGHSIHIGVDAWDFTPVPLETLEEIITREMI